MCLVEVEGSPKPVSALNFFWSLSKFALSLYIDRFLR